MDGRSDIYQCMLALINACREVWQAAWVPGEYIVCDECMIFWKGTGEAHVTFQGRKPTEYGLELKALACGLTHIMLNIDLAEGKDRDARKEYRDEVGASVATTLLLCKPYKGSGRCVIGDSWFGSCNTSEWLWDELGLHSILAVKTGHRGFPKS